MNREQFISKLEHTLKKLPKDERQDILLDFKEHFDIGLQKGKTEEDIAASLGSPSQIAKEIMAEYYLDRAEGTSSISNIISAVWAAIGLGFFNIVIVLGPFIALVFLVLSGWVIGISFLASPILVGINLAVYPDSFALFDGFASMALVGAGLLIVVGMIYVTRFVYTGFIKYLRYNARLVKGGLKHD